MRVPFSPRLLRRCSYSRSSILSLRFLLVAIICSTAMQSGVDAGPPLRTRSRSLVVTETVTVSATSDETLTGSFTGELTATVPSITKYDTYTVSQTSTDWRSASRTVSDSLTLTASNTETKSVTRTWEATQSRTSTGSKDASLTRTGSSSFSVTQSPPVTLSLPSKAITSSETWTGNMSVSSSDQVTVSDSSTEELYVTSTNTIFSHATLTATVTLSKEPTYTGTYYHDSSTRRETRTASLSLRLSHTRTLMLTATGAVTPTATMILTLTHSETNWLSQTNTLIETRSKTVEETVTMSHTREWSDSDTETVSASPSDSADRSGTKSPTESRSGTDRPSMSRSSSPSATDDDTASRSLSQTQSKTRSLVPTPTSTASSSATPTWTSSPSLTDEASESATTEPTSTERLTGTGSETMTASLTSGTVSVTVMQSPTASIIPTESRTVNETLSQSLTGTLTSDMTMTATVTLTPPPTLTQTLSEHHPVTFGNLAKFFVSLFLDDFVPCMRVVTYIGLFPFTALLVSFVIAMICFFCFPTIRVDTFAHVKQWRSMVAHHAYLSVLFPCHFQCAVLHALLALIHLNLLVVIVSGITRALASNGDDSSPVVIALAAVVGSTAPHAVRPIFAKICMYFTFDRRDLKFLAYVDMTVETPKSSSSDEAEDDEVRVTTTAGSKHVSDGGEAMQHPSSAGGASGTMVGLEFGGGKTFSDNSDSTLGNIDLPEDPADARAFGTLHSFVFDFADDVKSQRSAQPHRATTPAPLPGTFDDAGVFGDFTPLHTPRAAPIVVEMPEPIAFPYAPITAHILFKCLGFLFVMIVLTTANFLITQQIHDLGGCNVEFTGFFQALLIALVLDVVVMQQAYLLCLYGLRWVNAVEDEVGIPRMWADLHPFTGDMRPLTGSLLRELMNHESEIARRAAAEKDVIDVDMAPHMDDEAVFNEIIEVDPAIESLGTSQRTHSTASRSSDEEQEEEDEEEETEEDDEDAPAPSAMRPISKAGSNNNVGHASTPQHAGRIGGTVSGGRGGGGLVSRNDARQPTPSSSSSPPPLLPRHTPTTTTRTVNPTEPSNNINNNAMRPGSRQSDSTPRQPPMRRQGTLTPGGMSNRVPMLTGRRPSAYDAGNDVEEIDFE